MVRLSRGRGAAIMIGKSEKGRRVSIGSEARWSGKFPFPGRHRRWVLLWGVPLTRRTRPLLLLPNPPSCRLQRQTPTTIKPTHFKPVARPGDPLRRSPRRFSPCGKSVKHVSNHGKSDMQCIKHHFSGCTLWACQAALAAQPAGLPQPSPPLRSLASPALAACQTAAV